MLVRRLREDELYHYGVNGMKWRKKKAKDNDKKKKPSSKEIIAIAKASFNIITGRGNKKHKLTVSEIKKRYANHTITKNVTKAANNIINTVKGEKLKDILVASK